MDLVLSICDDLVLDRVWSQLVPLSAFTEAAPGVFSSSSTAINASLKRVPPSTWAHIVSSLPHPPISTFNATRLPYSELAAVSAWPRTYFLRQVLSLSVITLIGIHLLYFIFAGLSYMFIFNHEMMRHPKFLKNQVRLEMISSLKAFPAITVLTLPFFVGEVRGHSFLYGDVSDFGWIYFFASIPM